MGFCWGFCHLLKVQGQRGFFLKFRLTGFLLFVVMELMAGNENQPGTICQNGEVGLVYRPLQKNLIFILQPIPKCSFSTSVLHIFPAEHLLQQPL